MTAPLKNSPLNTTFIYIYFCSSSSIISFIIESFYLVMACHNCYCHTHQVRVHTGVITCMRGVVTESPCVSESQLHCLLTPVNPHFLLQWRSGINKTHHKNHLASCIFSCCCFVVTVTLLKPRLCLCVFHLYSLDLWGLDDRRLCSLDDTVDLNRLSIGKLYQRYRGTCC